MEDNKELMEMDEEVTLSYQDDDEKEESEITEVSLAQAAGAAVIVAVVGYGFGKGAEFAYRKAAPAVKGWWKRVTSKVKKPKKSDPIDVDARDVDSKES